VDELVRRALAQPQGAGAQPEGGERFDKRNLRRLPKVEGATHRGDDGGEAVHLALARAMLLVDVVEEATSDRGGQSFGHVFEAALRQGEDLVVVGLALDGTREQL